MTGWLEHDPTATTFTSSVPVLRERAIPDSDAGATRREMALRAVDPVIEQLWLRSHASPVRSRSPAAARRLLDLVDRAQARDCADAYALAQRFDTTLLLDRAAEIDPGFDPTVLATMLGSLARFDDSDIPVPADAIDDLRRFFRDRRYRLLTEAGNNDQP